MAINGLMVTCQVNPVKAPCPPAGAKFTVTATVTSVAVGVGGNYDVSIYADQGFWPDTLLVAQLGNNVGAGRKVKVYTFTLTCDANCKIAGALATSGNNPCDIYAYAVDNVGGAKAQSGKKMLECMHDDQPQERGPEKSRRRTPQAKVKKTKR